SLARSIASRRARVSSSTTAASRRSSAAPRTSKSSPCLPTAERSMDRTERIARFHEAIAERTVIIDGAMGTMIQSYGLDEAAYRGSDLRDHPKSLKGCNDLLCLTKPDVVEEIHARYLDAGAEILETNTFNATRLNPGQYGLE